MPFFEALALEYIYIYIFFSNYRKSFIADRPYLKRNRPLKRRALGGSLF